MVKFNSKVALIKGDNRYENIAQALALIEDEIDLSGKERVLIKPNFVSTRRQLAATHVEAVRAVLSFLQERYDGPVIIGEGAALSDTFEGYENFGYLPLADEYDVQLMDLNRDRWVEIQVYDRGLRPLQLRVAKTVVESDYRISVGPPKTHDAVIVTLSLKNMIVGSLIRDQRDGQRSAFLHKVGQLVPSSVKESHLLEGLKSEVVSTVSRSDKMAMHQGYPVLNLNLYTLAKLIPPHLSVIDGFVGMEGAGPTSGDPVDLRLAIASTDFLAADAVATKLMGFDLDEVGYLHYCKLGGLGAGDLGDIEIVGNAAIEECARRFRPHPTYKQQLEWRIPDVEQSL